MQRLFDVVEDYGREFGVAFSNEKGKIMIVNRAEDEKNTTWRLDFNELEQTRKYKYLGVWMYANEDNEAKNREMNMMNQWVGSLGSTEKMRANTYDVMREVWKSSNSCFEYYIWNG